MPFDVCEAKPVTKAQGDESTVLVSIAGELERGNGAVPGVPDERKPKLPFPTLCTQAAAELQCGLMLIRQTKGAVDAGSARLWNVNEGEIVNVLLAYTPLSVPDSMCQPAHIGSHVNGTES